MGLPWHPFLTVWGLLALNIASPGPNVLNTIATAMGSGRQAGLGSAAGVGVGVALWCLAMSLGAAALFALLPWTRPILTLIAIALLLRFAWRYLRLAVADWHGMRAGVSPARDRNDFAAAFRRSLAINALNPKALTTWIAILAIFPVAAATPADIAVLGLGASAVAVGLHTAYALAFSTTLAARLYFRFAWLLTAVAGLFFTGFALRLALGLVRSGS